MQVVCGGAAGVWCRGSVNGSVNGGRRQRLRVVEGLGYEGYEWSNGSGSGTSEKPKGRARARSCVVER